MWSHDTTWPQRDQHHNLRASRFLGCLKKRDRLSRGRVADPAPAIVETVSQSHQPNRDKETSYRLPDSSGYQAWERLSLGARGPCLLKKPLLDGPDRIVRLEFRAHVGDLLLVGGAAD